MIHYVISEEQVSIISTALFDAVGAYEVFFDDEDHRHDIIQNGVKVLDKIKILDEFLSTKLTQDLLDI